MTGACAARPVVVKPSARGTPSTDGTASVRRTVFISLPSFRSTGAAVVQQQPARSMATLKQIQIRLKSVTNIQKITQSMKMVSAAKYARAERELRQARPYGDGVKVIER